MIPMANIIEWQEKSPWITMEQIEQDLILSRILIELYSHPSLKNKMLFRGGTALHKLFIQPAGRYSEDVDLVQIHQEPIGPCLKSIRETLDPWLGAPTWKLKRGRVVLYYRFEPETAQGRSMRVKIEINTREHFSHFEPIEVNHTLESSWFTGSASIRTFCLEELLGTKLRALYQRKKGRDLYDLFIVTHTFPGLNHDSVIEIFQKYLAYENKTVSRAEFEANFRNKVEDPSFTGDITPLLSSNQLHQYDPLEAAEIVMEHFLSRLPGEPWKGIEKEGKVLNVI